jgi:hypothetical protein
MEYFMSMQILLNIHFSVCALAAELITVLLIMTTGKVRAELLSTCYLYWFCGGGIFSLYIVSFLFFRILSFRFACKIWGFAISEMMQKTPFFSLQSEKFFASVSYLFASKRNDRRTLLSAAWIWPTANGRETRVPMPQVDHAAYGVHLRQLFEAM